MKTEKMKADIYANREGRRRQQPPQDLQHCASYVTNKSNIEITSCHKERFTSCLCGSQIEKYIYTAERK